MTSRPRHHEGSRLGGLLAVLLAGSLVVAAEPGSADEGGVGFWLPGNFGSLAAVPSGPGWELALVYYHGVGSQSGDHSFPRGGRITAGADSRSDQLFVSPTYTFARGVAGGEASINLSAAIGYLTVEIDGTLNAPGGAVVSGHEEASGTGIGDPSPMVSLKWSHGEHHSMAYLSANVPVGTYDRDALTNMSISHWALDAGGGYTYFDQVNEISAAVGFTYNFENPQTDYRNGVDGHVDWAASRFVSPDVHVGLVGYLYDQLSGDSGDGALLGDFESRVAAIGPQAGWSFTVGEAEWYANLKGYFEFAARNRPQGWDAWLTLAIPF